MSFPFPILTPEEAAELINHGQNIGFSGFTAAGAAKAVRGGAASLLAAGVVEVKGDFAAGDAVWVDDEQGNHLAKGLVGFDSEEIPQMLGRNTAQLKRFLGEEYAHPLVHRDNLVLV